MTEPNYFTKYRGQLKGLTKGVMGELTDFTTTLITFFEANPSVAFMVTGMLIHDLHHSILSDIEVQNNIRKLMKEAEDKLIEIETKKNNKKQ